MNPQGGPSTIRTEILVIGSGPGGAVTATVLAEAGRSVLVIEEGQDLPLDSSAHFSRREMLEKYRGGGIGIAFGKAKIAYAEGRCVGGGSEVNRGLYHRTPAYVLDAWRTDFGVDDLSVESLAPHFAACEATARVEFLPGEAPAISTRLRDGAEALGWRTIEAPRLYRYGDNSGVGRKQSISETFIPRFRAAGGRLMANMRARRLRAISGKWQLEAVHAMDGVAPQAVTIIADTVFVACGAVQTPALLRRSGINRNIGNSLRFHPMMKLVAQFADEVNRPGDMDPVHQVTEFEPTIGMGCSISKPAMLGMALAHHPEGQRRIAAEWQRMGLYYVQSTGGRAKVRNLPFCHDPFVSVSYAPGDLARLSQGLVQLAEALFEGGAQTIYPSVAGLPAMRSRDALRLLPETFARTDGSMSSVHVFSSCPMGSDAARCATDSFGRLREANGLYIADASLLCSPTSVNPQGTVMAIAHRNAMHALEARFQ